jgi:uncharacterized membrane protein
MSIFPFQKPELMNVDSLSGFFLGIIIVFTACFGVFEGVTSGFFEGLITKWKIKHKSTSQ